jgi:NAD(P)-dependent dehydrogenase (short-subunit alcohol dehydrogenase family)
MSTIFDMTGKTVCVIGGGGYLNTPACREMAALGAHIVVADLNIDNAKRTAQAIGDAGHSAEAVTIDITDEPAVGAMIDSIVERHGKLDVIVNGTAWYENVLPEDMSLDDFRSGMKVNLDAAFVVSREAARVMGPRGAGSIILYSSMYGVVSPDPRAYPEGMNVNPLHYGVAKAGVLQLVRYWAVRLAPKSVRVNAIVPGPFPFPQMQQTDPQFIANLEQRVPMGRMGKQNEVAGAVVYLASDAASYTTGTSITVDGGWTAW